MRNILFSKKSFLFKAVLSNSQYLPFLRKFLHRWNCTRKLCNINIKIYKKLQLQNYKIQLQLQLQNYSYKITITVITYKTFYSKIRRLNQLIMIRAMFVDCAWNYRKKFNPYCIFTNSLAVYSGNGSGSFNCRCPASITLQIAWTVHREYNQCIVVIFVRAYCPIDSLRNPFR